MRLNHLRNLAVKGIDTRYSQIAHEAISSNMHRVSHSPRSFRFTFHSVLADRMLRRSP